MSTDTSLHTSPQLEVREQNGVAVALSGKQIISLYKKSEQSGIPFDTLQEVYRRGYEISESDQEAFNRVNSFIAGGEAMLIDNDLVEKRGLWDNIHAKRERIKHGSGEHMRKPGSKGAPSKQDFIDSQKTSHKEEYTGAEATSNDENNPANRFIGTDTLVQNYKSNTPGQSTLKTVKKVVKENKYYSKTGGMTQAGVDKYKRENPGSNLKTAVTKKPSELKKGGKAWNRRKSFCARMGGVKGPMKDEHGKPTRKALALRKWNC